MLTKEAECLLQPEQGDERADAEYEPDGVSDKQERFFHSFLSC